MRRTRLAGASIKQLKEGARTVERSKKEYFNYFKRLNENYSAGKISYSRYVEILYQKRNGRNIKEWMDYLDKYEEEYDIEIKRQQRKEAAKKISLIFFSLALIGLLIFLFYSEIQPSIIGFTIKGNEFELSQKISLEFSQSQNYEFQINETGKLSSIKLSGNMQGIGVAKVYLDDLLIYSGEINSEEVPQTDKTSPSQEELLPSEIPTESFADICEQTCNLEKLNLNQPSYTLRIELSGNTKLNLEEIKYTLIEEVQPETQEPIPEAVIPEENITPETNITPSTTPEVILTEENITTETNATTTILTEENATIQTVQYQAVLNQKVRWKKQISPEATGNLTIKLPKEAENIIVNKIENQNKEKVSPLSITGAAISNGKGFFARLFLFLGLTGKAVSNPEQQEKEIEVDLEIENSNAEYEIEYETPAPYAIEQETETGKEVKIIGLESINYENVLSFTDLNENLNINNPSEVKIYWKENNAYLPVQKIEDTNSNGIYDYVEWQIPLLSSNQTFEIIVITKANHLDFNRTFISDIYEQVKALDNIWSETIPDSHYIRVTFEKNLTNEKDITIFPRVVSGTPKVEVYEKDGNELIAEFTNITSNDYNKVYLTNLQNIQDTFDLRVVGGNIEIDYIVDPVVVVSVGTTDIGMAPLDNQTFVIAYVNSSNLVAFEIWGTNGTRERGPVIVSNTAIPATTSRVSVASVNSTSFIIGWSNSSGTSGAYLLAGYNRGTGTTYFAANYTWRPNFGNAIQDNELTIAGGVLFYCFINASTSNSPNQTLITRHNTTTGNLIGVNTTINAEIGGDSGRLNNTISCDAVNSTAIVFAEYDDATDDDITWHIASTAGVETLTDQDADTNVGNYAQVAVTGLNQNRFAGVFYDQVDGDVTYWVNQTIAGTGVIATDIDSNVGVSKMNTTRVAITTVWNSSTNQDNFVITWTNATGLWAIGYNASGIQSTPRFRIDTSISNFSHYMLGKEANGMSLCNGTWVIAYRNASNTMKFGTYWLNGSAWNGNCTAAAPPTNPPNVTNIQWLSVGGSNATNFTYGTIIKYFNVTVNDTEQNPLSVNITLLDPDLIPVINNQPMSNSTYSYWNYSTPIALEKAGNWTVNITATDGSNLASNFTKIFISITKQTTREGWYGYSYKNISSSNEINDLLNYQVDLLELQQNYSILNATWLNMKVAINNSYKVNLRNGINIVWNYNYSNSNEEKNATYNITKMFPDLLGDPYSITVEYISIELYNTTWYTVSQLVNTTNTLAEYILLATNNKFPVFVKQYNFSGFDSAYVRYTPMLYLTGSNESVLMTNEISTIRTNLSLNRIYYNLTSTTKTTAMNTHSVYSTLRSVLNSTSFGETNVVSLNNLDILVFNNQSTAQNYTITSSEIPVTGKDVWTHADGYLIEADTDNTFNVSVAPYSISVVYFEDLDHLSLSSNETATLYKQTVPFTGNANYTQGRPQTGNWNLDQNNDILIDLYDPHYYVKNNFITYYGWLNESISKVNFKEMCDNEVIIIADKNNSWSNIGVDRLTANCTNASEIYGYISVGDYSNTQAWFNNKTDEVENWTILNESMNIFIDGIDIGVGGANFSSRMKDLVDYVQIQRGKKAILNTYTAYEQFSTWGQGGVMKESCVNRWNGASAFPPDNYSREDWGLELNKSKWYHSNNIRVLCQAFNNRTTDGSNVIYNATELQDIYFASKVLGYSYFYLSQPDFNYAFVEYVYDTGASLSSSALTEDNETYYRLYEEGIIYYNISSKHGWIDDGRVIENSQVCFNLYDANSTNPVTLNFNINKPGTTDTGDYQINDANLSAPFSWQYVCANISNPPNNGRYLLEAWVMPRSTAVAHGLYLNNTFNFNYSVYSYYDSAVTDSWGAYESGRNWGANIKLTDTKRASLDTTDKIVQINTFPSSPSENTTINISSAYTFNVSIYSNVVSLNSSQFYNITYNGVIMNVTDNSDCDTANPTFANTTINGEIHGACRKLVGDNYSITIKVPSLSERVYQITQPPLPDETPPNITIVFPLNNTNSSNNNLDVNYSARDNIALDSCWYSNDSFSVNMSLPDCSTNITSVAWIDGVHNVRVYANDTVGNINSSAVTFTIDTISPNIAIIYPPNNTNTSNININVNYTVNNGFSYCWYSNTSGAVNYSLANCANITGVTWLQGINNVTVWVNDTVGNQNSSSVRFTVDSLGPDVVFKSQNPADISSTNLYTASGLNITYNITDATGVNASRVFMYSKTNSTSSDISYYINGTPFSGFQTNTGTNQSSNWSFSLMCDSAYPSKFNINQTIMENTLHSFINLDSDSKYIKIEFLNVSNLTRYNVFLSMNNASTSANHLDFYYCNSSYSTGDPNSNSNCLVFFNQDPTPLFNFTHNSSSYKIVPMTITNGRVNDLVKVTSTSYFLLGGSTLGGGRYVYYINNTARANATQTTSDNGLTWISQNYTADVHLSQYNGTDTFYYYVCANDTLNFQNCSSVRSDLIDLAGLPPSSPDVYSPASGSYSGNININYTASVSPNGYAISFYNISLMNANETYNKTIITNNSLNLSYVWNTVGTLDGSYLIEVIATDNVSQKSSGFSENFTIDNTSPQISIVYPSNNTNTTNTQINVNYTVYNGYSYCWYSNDSFSINNSLTNCGNITGVTWVGGVHNVRIYANDSAGNINSSSVRFTVDIIKPNISIIFPSNNTNTTNININVNYTRSDNIFLSSCWYSNTSGVVNYTLNNCANITGVAWLQGINNVTIWANDSAGNQNSSSVRFVVDIIKPDIAITYPANNTNTTNININVNYTRSDNIFVSSCWYSNTSGIVNYSLSGCGNITGVTWLERVNNVTIWTNDSAGNQNYSSVRFTVDTIPPSIQIVYPANNTNTTNTQINVNYTVSDSGIGVQNCWYSNTSGVVNYTLNNCANITGVTWLQGINNVTIWVNDTLDNENFSRVTFTVDTIPPDITINSPQNITYNIPINHTITTTDSIGISSCWFTLNNGLSNTTMENLAENIYNYSESAVFSDGGYFAQYYCNDTAGNTNNTNISFAIDNTPPYFTNLANQTLTEGESLNYTINAQDSGVGLESFAINWTDTFNIGTSTGELTNISELIVGEYYINVSVNDTLGNLNSTILLVNITSGAPANNAPNITAVYNATTTTTLLEGPLSTSITINFTAYDQDGNLNDTTASVNISLTGEVTRQNTSCSRYQSSPTYSNYTCNITMWWYDAAGNWNITAFIMDNTTLSNQNNSVTLYVGATFGLAISPGNLTWGIFMPGSTNQTSSNDPLNLTNTGNQPVGTTAGTSNITINATHLHGEIDNTKILFANNFSVSTTTGGEACSGAACLECGGGTQGNLSYSRFVNITSAFLPKGNYTIGDGTGQEQLYFCLRIVGTEVTGQPYSTSQEGSWIIRIFLVAIIPARRKKKKERLQDDKLLDALNLIAEDLRKEYSLNKEELLDIITEKLKGRYGVEKEEILKAIKPEESSIPITIFSKQLGGLEAITKYMKENLNMPYSEIAKHLERDERTIWTSYKKAGEKQKEIFSEEKEGILIPLSIFKNSELTIFESVISYLKEKGIKYSEIARLLNRDQRNIRTIYIRTINKKKRNV